MYRGAMLPKCEACHGLVPLGESACPNCADGTPVHGAARTAKKVGVGVLTCLAGAGVSLTLMACYGGPAMIGPIEPPQTSASAPAPGPDSTDTAAPLATDPPPAASTPK